MDGQFGPAQSTITRKLSRDTRLRGRWLRFAQGAWLVIALLSVVYFVANVPGAYANVQQVCTKSVCPALVLTPENVKELQVLGISIGFFATYLIAAGIVSLVVWFTVGFVIFWHKSDERMALFAALACVTFGVVATSVSSPDTLAASNPGWWLLDNFVKFVGETCIFLFFYLFPDGRFVPRWTLVLACVLIVLFGCLYFLPNLPLSRWLSSFIAVWPVVFLAVGIFAQFYRYRRVSSPAQRQQTKVVVFGLTISVVGYEGMLLVLPRLGLPHAIFVLVTVTFVYAFLLLVPLSIGYAILRDRLWEISILVNRTLVYGALTACVIGIYVLVVGAFSALFQVRSNLFISLLATGLVAVLVQPLRNRLQRAVNRLVYGERDDPYTVLARLGQRLEATLAPEAVLPTIVETIAQALKLPYAAIALKQGDAFAIVASYGEYKETDENETLYRLPLAPQNEMIGELLLAPRAPGETFTAADQRLLHDFAHQVGVAVYALRLTADLQRLTHELQSSRAQLVTAREEERRRLRRDLHDGLGSELTSVTFKLGAASNLLDRDPAAVRILLEELKSQTQASIADIRRLVYNLRPPILDEWGLVPAVREYVAQYQLNHVRVTVEAPESLPALPAAVEVAAYRIAIEALANVTRHAQATTCKMRLDVTDDTLIVEVQDDGVGLPPGYHAGVGISAMRERATELGGTCVVETVATGGTRVYAQLPRLQE